MARFESLLESFRVARQMSKKELADQAELSPGYISLLSRGERNYPSKDTVKKLVDALKLNGQERLQFFEAAGYPSENFSFPVYPGGEVGQGVGVRDREDWGEAPNVQGFYGRGNELGKLEQWIINDSCQMVAVLGMGGLGKTLVAAQLAGQIKERFDYVFWRSLQNMPPLESILKNCIQFLSNQKQTNLPGDVDGLIALLLKYLQTYRCLIVLDNFEAVLRQGNRAGQYQEGHEDYSKLLQRLGESRHKSCLLLTSREKPREFPRLEGKRLPVRSMLLAGIEPVEAREILKEEELEGSDEAWGRLVKLYSGNPLVLKLASESIRELFHGSIDAFLQYEEPFFGDIQDFLSQQLTHLSKLEWELLYWLAIEREALALEVLNHDLVGPVPRKVLLEALDSLRRRYIIQTNGVARFNLQPVIMEYITARFIEQVYQELVAKPSLKTLELFASHALMKAQAKEYVRNSQIRLILKPLADRLQTVLGKEGRERRLKEIVTLLQATVPHTNGYAAGNVLNLLIHMQVDLSGYDFSSLTIWEAYLQEVSLAGVNYAGADLARCVFTDAFGSILSIALSPDGHYLAAGTTNGEVRLWEVSTGTLLRTYQGHTDWVRSIAFNHNGRLLASGSYDQTVRLWEVSSERSLHTLHVGTSRVYSVVFSPDGQTLASGHETHTVHLWEVSTGQHLRSLEGHNDRVWSVTFSPDGQTLASGSEDSTIRLWEMEAGRCLRTLEGHTNWVYAVVFSRDGKQLMSGSKDQTVRFWEVSTGQCLKTLQGYINGIYSVAFSPNGELLASGSEDQKIRLWNVAEGYCFQRLPGHTNSIRVVAFSPDGRVLASGSEDQTVRLWEVNTGRCINVLQGHSDWVRAVAFSSDGKFLATGGEDRTIRLWEVSTGRCLQILQGHRGRIYSVVLSPDGNMLASGGEEQEIWLWEVNTGQCLRVLSGNRGRICSVAFSSDGSRLASGSEDQTVRLWDVNTGHCLHTLQGHSVWVYSVAFHPKRNIVASGSGDGTIKYWDMLTGTHQQTLRDDRPYEGMNITNVIGLNATQKAMLKALGAIEAESSKN